MTDLIKVKGLKGKQNKKKWNKNIDVSGLLQHLSKQHTQKIQQKFVSPLVVEAQTDRIRLPLDPNRFKSKGISLPKPKYNNKPKKESFIQEQISDPWSQSIKVNSKYKIPDVPTIIKPQTGHSYNPSQQGIKKLVEKVIDYQGQKQKKTKQIKKPVFKQQQVRHRNKNLRAQQLQIRQRKQAKQILHETHSHKKILKQMQNKSEQINRKVKQREEKRKKLEEQAKTGKVRYGKKIGKLQYRFRQQLPNKDQIGKKLSHVGGSQSLIKDRFDSVYRRGIFEPRVIKVHANKTKKIKSKTKYREDLPKSNLNFIQ